MSKNDTPRQKISVVLRDVDIAALDTAAADVRRDTGTHVDRSSIIAAIIESADLTKTARAIAKAKGGAS